MSNKRAPIQPGDHILYELTPAQAEILHELDELTTDREHIQRRLARLENTIKAKAVLMWDILRNADGRADTSDLRGKALSIRGHNGKEVLVEHVPAPPQIPPFLVPIFPPPQEG